MQSWVFFFPLHSCYLQLPLRTNSLPLAVGKNLTRCGWAVPEKTAGAGDIPPGRNQEADQRRGELLGCGVSWWLGKAGWRREMHFSVPGHHSRTRQCLAIVPVPGTPSTASLPVLHGCQQSAVSNPCAQCCWGEGPLGSPSLNCSP